MRATFHKLRVAEIRREAADAVSVRFDVPPDLADDYRFAAGQYLTLRTTIDGREQRRSYSICAGPDDGELRIAIKRVPEGVVSTWANESLAEGDVLDVMTPTGRFGAAEEPGVHLGIAAGSGITPILSIARAVLGRSAESRFVLVYGNQTVGGMLFRTALEELKDRYLGRFSTFHVLSREEQDIPVLNGRIDGPKMTLILRHLVPAETVDHAYICGPSGLAEEVEPALVAAGVPAGRIHVERFVSAREGLPKARPPVADAPPAHVARLVLDGVARDVPVREGEFVLDAALRAGLDLPYACKGGMCSTCRARVTEGEVRMAVNYGLEPWETEAGFVLTCQSLPLTPRVVVDYDQV